MSAETTDDTARLAPADRRSLVIARRLAGASWDEAAQAAGYYDRRTARTQVLKQVDRDIREAERSLEGARRLRELLLAGGTS